jgi:hypothetical protein
MTAALYFSVAAIPISGRLLAGHLNPVWPVRRNLKHTAHINATLRYLGSPWVFSPTGSRPAHPAREIWMHVTPGIKNYLLRRHLFAGASERQFDGRSHRIGAERLFSWCWSPGS